MTRETYILSDLLSLLSLRPDDATVSKQDFDYLFCETLLHYLSTPDDETELFISWVAKTVYQVAVGDEFLDSTPADFIRDYLGYRARQDNKLRQMHIADRIDFLTLIISALFTIHIGGLWPQLFDRIDALGNRRLRPQFKLVEMFLNRFG